MTPANIYKHKNCRDVAIYVNKIFQPTDKNCIFAQIFWINIVNPEKWFIMMDSLIQLEIKKLEDWVQIGSGYDKIK